LTVISNCWWTTLGDLLIQVTAYRGECIDRFDSNKQLLADNV